MSGYASSFAISGTGTSVVGNIINIDTTRVPYFGSAITGTPSNTTFLRGDGTWAVPAGGGGTPAGATGEIQFNNAGAFGADSGLFWDNTTKYFAVGSSTTQITSEIFLQLVKNDNSYRSIGVKNLSSGTLACGDFTAVRNDGTISSNFASFGINSSGYNDPTYPLQSAGSAYAFCNGGDFVIGTQTAHNLIFHTGGVATTDEAMIIKGAGAEKGYVGIIEGTVNNPTLLGKLHIINQDDTKGTFFVDRYSPTSGQTSVLTIRKARGTFASPSAVQTDDGLGGLSFRGYGATEFSAAGRASIVGRAGQVWNDTQQGAYMQFLVTPNGGTATAEYMRLTDTALYSPTATTFSIFNTVTTTLNIGGAATAINIGTAAGTITTASATIVGTQTTQNLYNTVATTLNIGGAATAITFGATTGTLTLRNPTIVSSQASLTLFNTTTTTLTAFQAATSISMGATTGTLTLRNPTIVSAATTLTLFNTTTTTLNFAGAATTVNAFGAATTLEFGGITGSTMTANIIGNTTLSGNTKTVNIGLGGASGSTTAISIGSATTGSTNNIRFNVVAGSDATGDIWYRNSSGFLTRLAIGSAGQVLTVAAGLPSWSSASGTATSQTLASATGQATVANTTTATTILGTASGSKTITGGTMTTGTTVRITVKGTIATAVSAPTIAMIVTLGGTTVGTTNPNNTGTVTGTRQFELVFDINIASATTCTSHGTFRFFGSTSLVSSTWEIQPSGGPGQTTNISNISGNLAVDVLAQWGTASNQNTITGVSYTIEQLR